MKQILYLVLAIIAVAIVWRLLISLVGVVLGMVIHVAMIAIFCYLVYLVFKAMTSRERV